MHENILKYLEAFRYYTAPSLGPFLFEHEKKVQSSFLGYKIEIEKYIIANINCIHLSSL